MRYLGLDLGTTSLGVAISDKTNTLVSPLTLIKFKSEDYEDALKKLMDIINEKNITTVVLGLPKNMDNTMGFAAKRSLNFKDMLGKEGIKVMLEDERLTTVEAINIMKNNGVKKINEKNKTDIYPSRDVCALIYKFLKQNNGWAYSIEDLYFALDQSVTYGQLCFALDAFEQCGLVDCTNNIEMKKVSGKADLENTKASIRNLTTQLMQTGQAEETLRDFLEKD